MKKNNTRCSIKTAIFMLAAMLMLTACSSNSEGGGDSPSSSSKVDKYSYCVFIQSGICLDGTFDSCDEGGSLSNSCPFNSSNSAQAGSSSSSSVMPPSSSSNIVPSSNSITPSSSSLASSSSSSLANTSSSSAAASSSSIAPSSSSLAPPPSSSSIAASSSSSISVISGTFTDSRDNKVYKKVTIGTRTWMAENLNYDASGSKCYSNLESNCTTYGRLYDWSTAMGVCPSGWNLPSYLEWDGLKSYIQFEKGCTNCAAKHLKMNTSETGGWISNGNGLDSYGFSALPGGYGNSGSFNNVYFTGTWWSSEETDSYKARNLGMRYNSEDANWYNDDKSALFSVRCLQDYSSSHSTFTDDRDGKVYKNVTIGTQTWMAENLNYNAGGSCYDNLESNCTTYGRLYNWSTAIGVCPSGWHLPGDVEWGALMQFVNPSCYPTAGCYNTGKLLKAKSGWNDFNGNSGNGTDGYGFSALPGGYGNSDGGFGGVGDIGNWWSATEGNASYAYFRDMSGTDVNKRNIDKTFLFSVRCLKD